MVPQGMDELRHRLMARKKYGACGLNADRMEPPLERFQGPPGDWC